MLKLPSAIVETKENKTLAETKNSRRLSEKVTKEKVLSIKPAVTKEKNLQSSNLGAETRRR